MMASRPRIVQVPGNGGWGDIRNCNFYGWAERAFKQRGYTVKLPEGGMPDPLRARRAIWVPHIINEMCEQDAASSVIVGHSSGACAALRVAESSKVKGIVLVAAYDDPLGDANEAASGYFDEPFDWSAIRNNCDFVVQFAGAQDQFLPIDVQRRVAQSLNLTSCLSASEVSPENAFVYFELPRGDHFFSPPFDDLVESVDGCLGYL